MYGGLAYGWGAYGQGIVDEGPAPPTPTIAKGYAKTTSGPKFGAKTEAS